MNALEQNEKIGIPSIPQGVYMSRTCYPDGSIYYDTFLLCGARFVELITFLLK